MDCLRRCFWIPAFAGMTRGLLHGDNARVAREAISDYSWVARSERSDGRGDLTIHAHRYAQSVPPNTQCLWGPVFNFFACNGLRAIDKGL